MTEESSNLLGILKYPATVFSILVALIVAKYTLGITFGSVTEISAEGVKFSQEEKGELADLASKLNGATAAIDALQKQAPAGTLSSQAQLAVFEAAQKVSDQTAQVANFSKSASNASGRQGYIWIGNYNGSWHPAELAALNTGQPVTAPPEQLAAGTEYQVLGNMVVRDGLPENNATYYQGRKGLGTIPRGTTIRLVAAPTSIQREVATQIWAQVEVP